MFDLVSRYPTTQIFSGAMATAIHRVGTLVELTKPGWAIQLLADFQTRMEGGASRLRKNLGARDRRDGRTEPRGRHTWNGMLTDWAASLDAVPTATRRVAAANPRLQQNCSWIMRA